MIRNSLPYKWIIGGIVLLIIIAGACYLWYQHDTAPYRQDAAEAAKVAREWEATQKADTNGKTEQAAGKPAESTKPTADKPASQTVGTVVEDNKTETQQQSETPVNTAEVSEDVPVSPFGFGPYPELGDYPYKVIWANKDRPRAELLTRVLIKLWNEGERNFDGGSTHNGKVYPHYHDTVYVKFSPVRNKDGKIIGQSTHIKSGTQVRFTRADLLNPPPGLRVLDLDSSGIDPYQYLNLPLRKREK